MKAFCVLVLVLVVTSSLYAQDIKSNKDSSLFLLTLSTYNHAELVYNGTLTYTFRNDQMSISRRNLFSKKDEVVYSAQIDKTLLDPVKNLKMDTLTNFYYNYCIMGTSGDEYFISIATGAVEKRIHLHHYYHPQVEQLINAVNAFMPDTYRIHYLRKDTKQDCKP